MGIWETLTVYQRAPDTSAVLSPLGKCGDVLRTSLLNTKQNSLSVSLPFLPSLPFLLFFLSSLPIEAGKMFVNRPKKKS